jgi:hypothetical protein
MLIKYIIILMLYIILYSLFHKNNILFKKNYNLDNLGFTIINNVLTDTEINKLANEDIKNIKTYLLTNKKINNKIKKILGKEYQFQDYIWIIKKSKVHTCHRDNNGSFFNKNQKHESYTAIIYLEQMSKCLGVIPKSHLNKNSYNFNLVNRVENLECKKGDMIIFNSNLIHVGTLLEKKDNLRIQLKISHKDDIPTLSYYQNFNKIANKDNNLPDYLVNFQYNLSCLFPYLSNLTQNENIKSSGGSINGAKISLPQKIYSYLFYSDPNFYDLPNIS